jgi:lipoprotein-releasing system permease protein
MTQVAVSVPGTEYAQAGMLYGMDPDPEGGALTTVQRQIAEGELDFGPTSTGYPAMVMGRRLADKLSVFPGDTVLVYSLETYNTGGGGEVVPVVRPFEVTDRFSTGMYEYDNSFMYAAMEPLQELLKLGDGVGAVGVNVADPWTARETAGWIESELRFPYYTNDWVELNSSLFSALKLEKIVMSVILFLIVVVAAFNIISTLIMVVADKTREIGILKSMGMTDRTVLGIFMLQGLTIGVVGTLLGAGLGIGRAWALDTYQFIELPGDVYFLDSLPVALQPLDLAMIVILSVAVAFAATIYPARQASRLLPVEAIRHD